MKASKTAVSLAIAAALGAPLAAGTSEPRANAQSWIALTAEQRTAIVAKLESSKNCRYFETQVEARDVLGLRVDSKDIDDAMDCHRDQDALRDGGVMQATFSLPRYLAVNGAVALASALGVLGAALLLQSFGDGRKSRKASWLARRDDVSISPAACKRPPSAARD